jgi:hypothetical protein
MKFNLNHIVDPSDILLIYEGKFSTQTTKSVLLLAERNIDSITEDPGIKRKVFNILVECLQNVVKHGEELENTDLAGTVPVLMIGREDDQYIIASGNAMFTKNVKDLKSRIDEINILDKDGQKQLYKQIMRNNAMSEKGGAGLGLVDMARKSGEKLSYDFSNINHELSFFSLKTVIPRQINK